MCKGASGKQRASQPSDPPETLIPRTLNECQHAQTPHLRTIKELVKCRSEHPADFLPVWCQCLRPVFLVQEKELSVERVVKYVSAFAAYRNEEHEQECDAFVEEFLKHLLLLTNAANKTVRYRACQLIAEVMTRLADDVEVSDELWEELIKKMKQRMQDKVPGVRVTAARALARLVSGDENDSVVSVYRQALETDRSADVRKMVILSIPAINMTIPQIVERTTDVSDLVRKAVYLVLGNKFPIPMLSIMQRAKVLERGLADRVPAVQAECLSMLKTWLTRDCEGDVIALLRYLDVETNEKVGESVLNELQKQGLIKANEGEGLRQFLLPLTGDSTESGEYEAQLMGAEQALYWRVTCTYLHAEAQAKGNEAATTAGAQSVLNAAAAADSNEALDSILPPTVASYVELVTAHLNAGPHYRFAGRQLLLLAKVFEFTDSANRKVAGALVKSLLLAETPDSEPEGLHDLNSEVFIGDGLSLGGDQDWAAAVAEFAVKVYSEQGEYEKVVAEAVSRLGQPCRDGGAEASQWLHCLAVTSLLLERLMSLHQLVGCAIGSQEILDALLLPAVKHVHPEVQKAGLRCLGLFGQLATRPSSSVVRQLRLSISSGIAVVQNMAIKALFDLVLCHGATSLDRAIGIGSDMGPVPEPHAPDFQLPTDSKHLGLEGEELNAIRKPLLELLMSLLDSETIFEESEVDTSAEAETARSLVAEGFAKVLLQSKLFKDIQPVEDVILAKLLHLYFNEDLEISPRLQQCLSVFFNNYSVLSAENKKCVARAFIPVMRAEWPGVYGNKGVASAMVSAKKRATQLSRFMLQLLQNPLLSTAQEELPGQGADGEGENDQFPHGSNSPDSGQERLAINIAVEVKHLSGKTSTTAKAYVVAIARIASSLEFRRSAQEEIKCMIKLLILMMDVVAHDKLLVKELKALLAHLKSMDLTPEQDLTDEQLQVLLDNLKLSLPIENDEEEQAATPVAVSRKTPSKQSATKRAKKPAAVVESPVPVGITRSQRKSKSEALHRLSLSAAKQRIVASDESDEESSDSQGGNSSESDAADEEGVEVAAPKPTSSTGSLQRVKKPARMTRCPSVSIEDSTFSSAAQTPQRPVRDSSDASSVELDDEDSAMPIHPGPSSHVVQPVGASSKDTTQRKVATRGTNEVAKPGPRRTRRQVSGTASEGSTVNTQDTASSDVTADEATSVDSRAPPFSPIIELESSDSDTESQQVLKKNVKKSAPPAVKRPTTRRTAWK